MTATDQFGNLVAGDRVTWDAPQFSGGSFYRGRCKGARFTGTKRLSGIIERDSYGATTGQHTFSIRLDDGTLKRVKGRNLYPHLVEHIPGDNHEVAAIDKAARSTRNRIARGVM